MAEKHVKKTKGTPRGTQPPSKRKPQVKVTKCGRVTRTKCKPGGDQHVTEAEAEEMFKAFCERPTIKFVAERCNRAYGTVKRWRRKGNWDARIEAIRHDVQAKTGHDTAEMIARQVRMFRDFQTTAAAAVKRKAFRSKREKTSEAAMVGIEAAKNERVLLGEPGERVEVIGTLQERYARRKQTQGDQG